MKRPTKRKMYHKRRKKEKADQRKNDKTEATQTNNTPRLASKRKNNNNKKYHRMHSEFAKPLNLYTQGLQVWWHTYCTAIQYHTDQQKQFNKDQTEKDVASTKADSNLMLLEKYADEYETSSGEEEVEKQCLDEEEDYFLDNHNNLDTTLSSNADVDDEYLKFLEITHKHREELKMQRAEEDF